MSNLGYNYRLTDIHSALGLSQLSRVDSFVKKRNELAKIDDVAFDNLPIQRQILQSSCYSSYHLYVIPVRSLPKTSYPQVSHINVN